MGVSDQCKNAFMELQRKKVHRYVIFKVDEKKKEVVVEKTGGRPESYDVFTAALPENDCRYAVYDFDFVTSENCQKSKIFFIAWLVYCLYCLAMRSSFPHNLFIMIESIVILVALNHYHMHLSFIMLLTCFLLTQRWHVPALIFCIVCKHLHMFSCFPLGRSCNNSKPACSVGAMLSLSFLYTIRLQCTHKCSLFQEVLCAIVVLC